jgi:hypothetical protein
MTKRAFLFIVSLFLLAIPVLGDDLPQVLQPNETAYSAAEVATLTQGIATLEKTLNDYNLASRRYFPDEWKSRDFAVYTAGILSEKGYETLLVSGEGWPEGVHTWVLVGIPLGSKIAWVPVEATPEAGHSQQILGRIPRATDGVGKIWFDVRYLNFDTMIELPPNIAPVAKIRPPVSAVVAGEPTKLLALTSIDPDGEIILYQWNFGDGRTRVSTTWSVRHEFKEAGSYTILLAVIDNRGKSTTNSLTLRVIGQDEAGSSSSSGCGCGG